MNVLDIIERGGRDMVDAMVELIDGPDVPELTVQTLPLTTLPFGLSPLVWALVALCGTIIATAVIAGYVILSMLVANYTRFGPIIATAMVFAPLLGPFHTLSLVRPPFLQLITQTILGIFAIITTLVIMADLLGIPYNSYTKGEPHLTDAFWTHLRNLVSLSPGAGPRDPGLGGNHK